MGKEKRILFLADINSIHTERWVKGVIDNGYSVGLFSLAKRTSEWSVNLENFTYYSSGVGENGFTKKFSKISYFFAKNDLITFFKSFQPDIVHAHYASSYGMLARKINFDKTVLSVWGSDVYEFPKRSVIHRILFKKILKSATVICSTSVDMAKEIQLYTPKKIEITPFGVDTELFKPLDYKKNNFIIGSVKALETVYGIDRLLLLFASFLKEIDESAILKIYGKGSQKENLEALALELGVQNNVFFEGYVKGNDLINAFNSIDVFVNLSRAESFGVSVLEAQSCGVPVIVSNVGGLPEVVSNKSGFIINGDSIKEGLASLKELSFKERRKTMGKEGRLFVEQNYSKEYCINVLLDIYQKL